MHLNDAEIQIIEKLNHAPLSSKNKTVVEQIKKYIERENTDESAIINNIRTKINIHEQDYLNSLPAVEETKYLRHVHFEEPIVIKMDGKKKIGVVLKPEK